MSSRRRTECPKDGDEKEAGETNDPRRDSSLPPLLSSIPQSPTCRKIFFDDNFKVTPFPEATEEAMEQQKQKWNFDFQTETPLPGRYLWMRTEGSSGYYKNGKGAPLDNPPRRGEGQKRASKRSHRGEGEVTDGSRAKKKDSGILCDTALNESQESGESLCFSDTPLGIDLT